LSRIDWLAGDFGEELSIVCGADLDSPAFLEAGVHCWIGGIANLLPAAHVAMLDPDLRPEVFAAIAPILGFIESGKYNAKIKAGMNSLGAQVGCGLVRQLSHLNPMSPEFKNSNPYSPALGNGRQDSHEPNRMSTAA